MVGGSNPPSATSSLAEAVGSGLRAIGLPFETPLVLAVSGGADSMALLHGASTLARDGTYAGELRVAHLDHALRDDSAADARFVAKAATELDLPVHTHRTDVAALARAEGVSVEEAGRLARYRFLEDVAPEGAMIATAHTADDAAETVVINLLRGSGLSGVRGIPERRHRVVRPLLGERRATLRHWLDEAGIAYRDDPSNADPSFLRNRVRGEVLPLLEAVRPGAVDGIARFARLASDDDDLLDALAAAELERRRSPDGELDWREPPVRALGRRVLRRAIGHPAPSAERIEALLDAAEGSRGGLRIELGGGRVASVRERRIRLE